MRCAPLTAHGRTWTWQTLQTAIAQPEAAFPPEGSSLQATLNEAKEVLRSAAFDMLEKALRDAMRPFDGTWMESDMTTLQTAIAQAEAAFPPEGSSLQATLNEAKEVLRSAAFDMLEKALRDAMRPFDGTWTDSDMATLQTAIAQAEAAFPPEGSSLQATLNEAKEVLRSAAFDMLEKALRDAMRPFDGTWTDSDMATLQTAIAQAEAAFPPEGSSLQATLNEAKEVLRSGHSTCSKRHCAMRCAPSTAHGRTRTWQRCRRRSRKRRQRSHRKAARCKPL